MTFRYIIYYETQCCRMYLFVIEHVMVTVTHQLEHRRLQQFSEGVESQYGGVSTRKLNGWIEV
jgi:hypothetical protein